VDKLQTYAANPIEYWHAHPYGAFLLDRGGRHAPPPIYANLTLTNRCNLRCTICGSQSGLDRTGTPRSEMPVAMFRKIAETVFPVLLAVELNSAGEPLTYSHIIEVLETIARHDCDLILQTNGTVFTKRNVDLLVGCRGRVSMSIDAIGPLFNQLRVNGEWSEVDRGVRDLVARRDPGRLSLIATPAVTGRSVEGMLDVVRWCDEVGLDMVHFQAYESISEGPEAVPSPESMRRQADRIVEWCHKTGAGIRFGMSNALLYAPPGMEGLPSRVPYNFFPLEAGHPLANRHFLCTAPINAIDIGVDGDVAPCCAGQGVPLGWVDSVEGFADLWFGANMIKIRRSLLRNADGPLPHPSCAHCIGLKTPDLLGDRRSIDYTAADRPAEALVCELDRVPLAVVRHSGRPAHPNCARIPPGLDPTFYRLEEDEVPLGPQTDGTAPFVTHGLDLYFATSDGSDPVKNRRRYVLRRHSSGV